MLVTVSHAGATEGSKHCIGRSEAGCPVSVVRIDNSALVCMLGYEVLGVQMLLCSVCCSHIMSVVEQH